MLDQSENATEVHPNGPQVGQQQSPYQQEQTRQQFACLYTKHKTQKHKKWSDGRLIVNNYSCRLHDADPQPGAGDPMIDMCALSGHEAQSILSGARTNVETEKFLITIDGPWKAPTTVPTISQCTTTASQGMSKLLQTKFRKPKRMGPPPPPTSSTNNPVFSKRQRPLQPGELQNRYYGAQPTAPPPLMPPTQQQQQQVQNNTTRTNEFIAPPQGFNVSNFYEEEETVASWGMGPPVQFQKGSNSSDRSSKNTPPQHRLPPASFFTSPQPSQIDVGAPQHKQLCETNTEEELPRVAPQAFGLQPKTATTYSEGKPKQNAFVPTGDFRASQYYGDEEEEEDEVSASSPQAFSVSESYRSVRQDKASRAELLDFFSDKPSTTEEFVLPDESSSDES